MRLWDLATGRSADSLLERHKGMVVALAFSPDGSLLATTGGEDKEIRLWSVETVRTEAVLAGHLWDVLSVAFSPDGETLASGSADGTIRLWSVDEALHTGTLEGLGTWVQALAFSPDGSMLASGGRNGEVRLWDLAAGGHQVLPQRHRAMVYHLAFSPDGATLVSGGGGEARVWDVASGQSGAAFKDDWVRIPGRRHPGRTLSVTFPPEGGAVVTYGSRYAVRRWEVGSGELESTLHLESDHMEHVGSLAFSPDGKSLASTGLDHTVRLWDVEGRRLRTVLHGHGWNVYAVAFSPDGSLLASGEHRLGVRLWDVGSGRHLEATLGGGATGVGAVAFSPDGASLANTSGGASDISVVGGRCPVEEDPGRRAGQRDQRGLLTGWTDSRQWRAGGWSGCGTLTPETSEPTWKGAHLLRRGGARRPWPSLPTDGSSPVAAVCSGCGIRIPGSFAAIWRERTLVPWLSLPTDGSSPAVPAA